jgi:hypothetical protein
MANALGSQALSGGCVTGTAQKAAFRPQPFQLECRIM